MTKKEKILKAIADARNAFTPIAIHVDELADAADAQPPYVAPAVTLDPEAFADVRECRARLEALLALAYEESQGLP